MHACVYKDVYRYDFACMSMYAAAGVFQHTQTYVYAGYRCSNLTSTWCCSPAMAMLAMHPSGDCSKRIYGTGKAPASCFSQQALFPQWSYRRKQSVVVHNLRPQENRVGRLPRKLLPL